MKRRDQEHREQPTLWDSIVDQAVATADRNADSDWKEAAYECLAQVARRQISLTADDVVELLENRVETTHNPAALGGVFRRAAKNGLIKKTDMRSKSRIKRRHRELVVWRSLVFEVAK